MNMFKDVQDFHFKFGIHLNEKPAMLTMTESVFRTVRMQEELGEYIKAVTEQDLVKASDALADLIYFALGTAAQMGLPFEDIWDAVHTANMDKRKAHGNEGKYKDGKDVVKPPNWVGPEGRIRIALNEAGAK